MQETDHVTAFQLSSSHLLLYMHTIADPPIHTSYTPYTPYAPYTPHALYNPYALPITTLQ